MELPDPRKPKGHDGRPAVAVLALVHGMSKPGEDLIEAAKRIVLEEALWRCGGVQRDAAKLLRISPRVLNYHLAQYGMRPKDASGPLLRSVPAEL